MSAVRTGVVLVVDDDRGVRDVVEMALGDEGYSVRSAPDGSRALDLVDGERVDLILLDMRMPVMDGWAFAREYRARPGPHAPIVVITAAENAAGWAAQVEADGHVAKPFDLDELVAEVARHVS